MVVKLAGSSKGIVEIDVREDDGGVTVSSNGEDIMVIDDDGVTLLAHSKASGLPVEYIENEGRNFVVLMRV